MHLNVYEADTARIAVYRHYRVREKFPVPTTAIVLHLTYKEDVTRGIGEISNMEEVEQFFQKKIAVRKMTWLHCRSGHIVHWKWIQ